MRYMLLFLGLAAQPQASDEQTADYNVKWGEWMGSLAANHELLSGAPFQPTGTVVSAEKQEPLQLDRVDIGGFVQIEVETEERAIEIAGQAPHIALGGSTIVRPLVQT